MTDLERFKYLRGLTNDSMRRAIQEHEAAKLKALPADELKDYEDDVTNATECVALAEILLSRYLNGQIEI